MKAEFGEPAADSAPAQHPGWAELMRDAALASDKVHDELARLETGWKKMLDLQRPLRRKLLGRMCSHITSILAAAAAAQRLEVAATSACKPPRRSGEASGPSIPPSAIELTALALGKVESLDEMATPTLWEVKNLLRIACLDILDDAELHARVAEVHTRVKEEQQQTTKGEARRRRGSLLDADQLLDGIDPERGGVKPPHLRHKAVVGLRLFYQEHDDCGRYERALAEQRGICLKWISMGMLLLVLTISAPLVMYGIELDDKNAAIDVSRRIAALLVVLSAGTLGSLLALLLQFRDVFHRIGEMRAHWAVLPAQAAVGATLALVLFLIYRTGFIGLEGWPNLRVELVQLAVFSLIAGFSEPFVLRIIQRVEKLVE
jgi:hypothetical protein